MGMPSIQGMINRWFPPHTHPYRHLDALIVSAINPSSTVLDIGCGRTFPTLSRLKGKAGRLIGLDVVDFTIFDPTVELVSGSVESMAGIPSETIDVAYSRSVMEHIEHPELAFAEIARVLKPGGRYLALTPNFYDYASLIAFVIPNGLHGILVKSSEGREEADTFPTYFRANTRSATKKFATGSYLKLESFKHLGQYPNYFKFSRLLFWLMCYVHLFLARHQFTRPLQGWILYEVIKPIKC